MVEPQPSKLMMRVRFPLPAPKDWKFDFAMIESTGSLGPFEKTRISVINMAARIQEAVVIQRQKITWKSWQLSFCLIHIF